MTTPVKSNIESRDLARRSIGNGAGQNQTLRTQTFHVKGYDENNKRVEARIEAADKDHAIGIAHQRRIRVAECVPWKQPNMRRHYGHN